MSILYIYYIPNVYNIDFDSFYMYNKLHFGLIMCSSQLSKRQSGGKTNDFNSLLPAPFGHTLNVQSIHYSHDSINEFIHWLIKRKYRWTRCSSSIIPWLALCYFVPRCQKVNGSKCPCGACAVPADQANKSAPPLK